MLPSRLLRWICLFVFGCWLSTLAHAQTVLRLATGASRHVEVLREITEAYARENPEVKIEIETGGETGLPAMLTQSFAAKDGAIDLVVIDVLRLAQFVEAQWVEPLESYLDFTRDPNPARVFPVYRQTSAIGNRQYALPIAADALFLYFRKDLHEKYALQPPRTWEELKSNAQAILAGEKNPALRGFEMAGAPVETAVCSFLVPIWGNGDDLFRTGRAIFDGDAPRRPFQLMAEFKAAKLVPPNMAETPTDRVRQNMQAGNLVYGLSWGYARTRFEQDAETQVAGKIGQSLPPGSKPELMSSCAGGWQVMVSAFSRSKPEAAKFARYLASPEVARQFSLRTGQLPVYPELYENAELLAAHPWFAEALPVLKAARARPITPRYPEVSEVIRTNVAAFLAGTRSLDSAVADMALKLNAILR